jgi:hypothetical protein
MGRKQKRIHYIYRTTCSVNGKYYIGMHSTDNMEDGYLGSGKRLWNSINYHGRENHTKEILEFCDTREELKKREEEIVNEQLLTEDLCMNLKIGGEGGFISDEHRLRFINGSKKTKHLGNERLKWLRENDIEWLKKWSENITKGLVKWSKSGEYRNGFQGKQHNEETKQRMSESMKGKGKGETNSQFGTCWITKGGENKKIKKELLTVYQIKGWIKGRFY